MNGKNLLITGGTGFIGSTLVRELVARNNRVWILTRFPDKQAPQSSVFYIEHFDEVPICEHIDAVINLAGHSLNCGRWNSELKQLIIDSRVETTTHLASWIHSRNHPPEVLISGSAVGWYGHQHKHHLTESSPAKDGFCHQLCRRWENAALAVSTCGTRVCTLRTGIVLERDGGPLKEMELQYNLGLGGLLGDGSQWWSWIHRHDLLRVIFFLLEETTISGPVNATAPYPVTQAEFAEQLSKTLHRPNRLNMPGWVMHWLMGEMADEILLDGQSVYPKKLIDNGFHFYYPRLACALEDLFLKKAAA